LNQGTCDCHLDKELSNLQGHCGCHFEKDAKNEDTLMHGKQD